MKRIVRPVIVVEGRILLPTYVMLDESSEPGTSFVAVPDEDATVDGALNEDAIRTRYNLPDFDAQSVYAPTSL